MSDWKKATNDKIARSLIEQVEILLEGKAKFIECADKTSTSKKIVIEYGYERKEK